MKLFVAGLSYKTAPVELREQLAVAPSKVRCAGCRLKIGGALSEMVVLSTCNRVEIYGVADKVNGNVPPLFKFLPSPVGQTFLSAGFCDFPVATPPNAGLETPPNRPPRMPALP